MTNPGELADRVAVDSRLRDVSRELIDMQRWQMGDVLGTFDSGLPFYHLVDTQTKMSVGGSNDINTIAGYTSQPNPSAPPRSGGT